MWHSATFDLASFATATLGLEAFFLVRPSWPATTSSTLPMWTSTQPGHPKNPTLGFWHHKRKPFCNFSGSMRNSSFVSPLLRINNTDVLSSGIMRTVCSKLGTWISKKPAILRVSAYNVTGGALSKVTSNEMVVVHSNMYDRIHLNAVRILQLYFVHCTIAYFHFRRIHSCFGTESSWLLAWLVHPLTSGWTSHCWWLPPPQAIRKGDHHPCYLQ